MRSNQDPANVYSYANMAFTQRRIQDIRVGDLVTVFNGEEVPADIVLINVEQTSAFFDTVTLDGEPVLSERYAAGSGNNIAATAI